MGSKKKEAKEKPLEKMTATELREIAKETPGITGAHGMNKAELVAEIKKARGIEDTGGKKKDASIRQIKVRIKALKEKRISALESDDRRMATIYKRQISRLKSRARRAG
jgi:hypothetical protein